MMFFIVLKELLHMCLKRWFLLNPPTTDQPTTDQLLTDRPTDRPTNDPPTQVLPTQTTRFYFKDSIIKKMFVFCKM